MGLKTTAGNVYNEPFKLLVSQGRVGGHSVVDKFGENPEIDTASTPEDIWEYGGEYTFTANAGTSYYFSSSDAGDTGQDIQFQVLTVDSNGNWNLEEFTQQTAGQTKTLLTPDSGDPIVRIFRMENNADAGNSLAGTLYVYEDDTVVAGVPQTPSLVRAIIDNGNNQTLMALYTIPTGYVGYLWKGEVGTSRAQASGVVQASYYSRRFGKLFKIKKRFDAVNTGTSTYIDIRSFPDPIPAKTDLLLKVESVSANGIGVFGAFDILLVREDLLEDAYLTAIGQIRRVE